MPPIARNKVFISYSHKDEKFLERLQTHLKPYEREGIFEYWSDKRLEAGSRWQEEIRKAIDSAQIAVLLVSADFLASEFIATNELPPLLDAAEKDDVQIIPVILNPCAFTNTPLGRFQAINDPDHALSGLTGHKRDEIWTKVSRLIADKLRFSQATEDTGTAFQSDGIAAFENALDFDPSIADDWIGKGDKLRSQDRFHEALESYVQALTLNSQDARAWNGKGLALGNLKKDKEALAAFASALALDPDNVLALYCSGIAYGHLKKYKEALDLSEKVLKLDSQNAEAWTNKGVVLNRLKRYEEAIAAFEQATKLNPRFSLAWTNKGITLGNVKRYDEELNSYQHALKLNPHDVTAWRNKIVLLLRMGRLGEAQKARQERDAALNAK